MSNLSVSVRRPCHKNCYYTTLQGRKCAIARQATKFPRKTSEVKVMDTNGARREDE